MALGRTKGGRTAPPCEAIPIGWPPDLRGCSAVQPCWSRRLTANVGGRSTTEIRREKTRGRRPEVFGCGGALLASGIDSCSGSGDAHDADCPAGEGTGRVPPGSEDPGARGPGAPVGGTARRCPSSSNCSSIPRASGSADRILLTGPSPDMPFPAVIRPTASSTSRSRAFVSQAEGTGIMQEHAGTDWFDNAPPGRRPSCAMPGRAADPRSRMAPTCAGPLRYSEREGS